MPKKKDEADIQTDKELSALEKKIEKEYQQAYDDLKKKYEGFIAENPKEKANEDFLKFHKGEISKEDYQKTLGKCLTAKKFQSLIDQFAEDLTTVDLKATSITKSYLSGAFALNHSFGLYQVEKDTNIKTSFSLYSQGAISYLFNKYKIIPDPKVDIPKDLRWNKQKLTSAVTQGILQGDDLSSIAKRFQSVTDMDKRAALRNARTAMTGAQNGGRWLAWQQARSLSIKVNKQWLATLDSHTRDSHAHLDGESVPLNKKFSNGLQYPGDPYGDNPSEIYNCRCTMVADLIDYPDDNSVQRYDNTEGKTIKAMTFAKWQEMKAKQAKAGDLVKNLDDANMKLEMLKAKIDSEGADKVFHDIWKEDVTYADYEDKKDSIESKKEYYTTSIEKWEKKFANESLSEFNEDDQKRIMKALTESESYADFFNNNEWIAYDLMDTSDMMDLWMQWEGSFSFKRISDLQEKMKLLEEFEKNGAKYSQYLAEKTELEKMIKELKSELKKANGSVSQFDEFSYEDDAKLMAFKFANKSKADKYFRPILDEQWGDLTDYEKYSLWQYTSGSGGFNRPLSGYENGSWSRSSFVGVGKAPWNSENRSYGITDGMLGKISGGKTEYDKSIASLTTAIEKCTFKDNCWLVRGSGQDGFAGLLEGDLFTYDQAMSLIRKGGKELSTALVGQEFQCHAFLSTGISEGSGFGGMVSYKIYCPKGTHAIYAEPQSAYGSTVSYGQIYRAGQSYQSVGSEAEMLIQRGTTFRITGIEKEYGGITVEMEVVAQPDYFETGWEQTADNGATSYKH